MGAAAIQFSLLKIAAREHWRERSIWYNNKLKQDPMIDAGLSAQGSS